MSTATIPTAPPVTAPGGLLNTAGLIERFFPGLSDQTIWKFIKDEGLPALRVKRRWYFDPVEVDAWLRERNRAATSAASAELDEHVRALVDQFPPLSAVQVDRIALMLRRGSA